MSLINQMLQELDARGSEATGAIQHGQIRAVPPSGRVSAAWLATAVLAVVSLAIGGWLWTHRLAPPQPAVQPITAPALLALQLESTLSTVPASAPVAPIAAASADAVSPEPDKAPALPAPVKTPIALKPATAPAKPVESGVKKVQQAPQVVEPAPFVAASSPAVSSFIGDNKEKAAAPVKTADSASPISINKKVEELTSPQRAENAYRKAASLIQQGKSADAESELEQALQLDSHHAAARQTLIGLLLEEKRQDDAVRRAQEGLSLDPGQAGLAMILARLQVGKGELDAALDTLQRTLPYAAERADYQAFLAALLQRADRNKEAIDHYVLALRKAPQSGVWWMGMGISLQAENRTTEAQQAFARAKSTNTLSPALQAFVEQKLKQLQP